jgi:hypothetical protein
MKAPFNVEEMVERRAVVLHLETGTVGRMARLHEPGEYTSPGNGKPVDARVVELEDGNSFVVKDGVFVPLAGREIEVWEMLSSVVTDSLKVAARTAAARQVDVEVFSVIAGSILRQHERQLMVVVSREREKRSSPR